MIVISVIADIFVKILIFLGKAIWFFIQCIFSAFGSNKSSPKQKAISQTASDIDNKLKEDKPISSLYAQKKPGQLMYAIVRREENGTWTQSNCITSDYEEARCILILERQRNKQPHLLRKVYV